eukprot:scaffold249333_cov87-Cyclotella_meneghiniana.AAC.1
MQLLAEKADTLTRDAASKTPLQDFQNLYPLIFEALESVFKWSASNSRIAELLHAFVRQIYEPNMPMECLDNRLNMLMGDEFLQRDERRDVAKKNRDSSLAYRKPKHLDRKETQRMQGEQLLHLEELEDEAKKAMSVHDTNWGQRGDIQFASVLPYIGALFTPPIKGEDATKRELKKKENKRKYSKTALLSTGGIIGKYLDLVKLIAKGKAENTFDVFVCADKSAKLAQLQDEVANQWRRMEDIFNSAASTISPRYQKLLNQPPRDISNESDEEEEE